MKNIKNKNKIVYNDKSENVSVNLPKNSLF